MCHSMRAACALSTRAVRKPQLRCLEAAGYGDGREADRTSWLDLQEMMLEAVGAVTGCCPGPLPGAANAPQKEKRKGMRKEVDKDQKVPLQ